MRLVGRQRRGAGRGELGLRFPVLGEGRLQFPKGQGVGVQDKELQTATQGADQRDNPCPGCCRMRHARDPYVVCVFKVGKAPKNHNVAPKHNRGSPGAVELP
jgi:hypothetical protein